MNSNIDVKDKSETDKLFKVAEFRQHIRKTEPHKHNNYFEIIYLSQGKGTHTIDQNSYQIQPPILFFVRKEQVHHWDISTIPKGYILIIKKEFIDKSFDSELRTLLSQLSGIALLYPKEYKTIEQLFELLITEQHFTVVEGLMKALFAKILETAKPLSNETHITNNIFQSYKDLLSKTDALKNNVSHYASLLNTSRQNLNTVCKKNTYQSATDVLAEYIINEAKRLLIYTDNTVSEIAYILDFADTSHFVKYFKRHTSKTPHAFRLS